jgi:hypothetical protein
MENPIPLTENKRNRGGSGWGFTKSQRGGGENESGGEKGGPANNKLIASGYRLKHEYTSGVTTVLPFFS